ncbi:hypothetical protein [Pseudomonas sp. BN515]|uniref:hypothetical protein n=1 Tax=Pseudomonas sp. BN515 TaxID=2567892 RepID=UPI002454D985|nr:hypothetical protein [Pseudomonas sp. BN515]MDH4872902.1 hypothetical protein [Pseudomonas sp. BN515]
MDVKEILLAKYGKPDSVNKGPEKSGLVVKAVDIPRIQLVMSTDDFTAEEIFKACGEFNRANPRYMNSSYTLLTDWTLPTGHILKAGSWVFRLDNL